MIELALALYLAFLVTAFGWRAWVQYRRTGDHGFRGFSGGVSWLERVAGLLFTVSLAAFLGAPLASLLGFLPCLELSASISLLGIVLALAGFALVLVAQLQMGVSWRVGVDPSERTALVTDGLFAVVRNPIFTALGVFAVGFALMVPNVLSASGLLLGALSLEIQVRNVEEPYLLRTHGNEYGEYAGRVGRFVPWVGRLVDGRFA